MNNVFYCYSPTLKRELLDIGEKYIAKTVNPSSNRACWIFLYTEKLIEHLNGRHKLNKKVKPNVKNPKFS